MSTAPTTKTSPLHLPSFVYDPAQSMLVSISNFQGSVYILGHNIDGSVEVLFTIACNTLIVNWPEPIQIQVPSYIDTESLDIAVVLVPSTLNNNQVIAQMEDII